MFRVCHVFLSANCSLVVTCWERPDLLALLYVMFNCVFVTFPCGVMGQVLVLISLPSFLLLVEKYLPSVGFEPTTFYLHVRCSTNLANPEVGKGKSCTLVPSGCVLESIPKGLHKSPCTCRILNND